MRTTPSTHAKQALSIAAAFAALLCAPGIAFAHPHDAGRAERAPRVERAYVAPRIERRIERAPRVERAYVAPRIERRIERAPRVERAYVAPRIERRIAGAPRVERAYVAPRIERRYERRYGRRYDYATRVERAYIAPRIERRYVRVPFEQRVYEPRYAGTRTRVVNAVPFVQYVQVPFYQPARLQYVNPATQWYAGQPARAYDGYNDYAPVYSNYAAASPYGQCLYSDQDQDDGYCAGQPAAYYDTYYDPYGQSNDDGRYGGYDQYGQYGGYDPYNGYAQYASYGTPLQQLQGIVVAKSGTMLMVLGANGLQPIFVNAAPAYQNGFASGTPGVGQVVNVFGYYNGNTFVATALQ